MKLLAFDTSTDVMSIAVTDGVRNWQHSGPGGARASTTLIPAVLALLAEAGLTVDELDAIAFGRGPGSFTGLRTACAVAQGLAFGARAGKGMPVLPVDTLMALAEEARFLHADKAGDGASLQVMAMLDARMDEIYVQHFLFNGTDCTAQGECTMVRPEDLHLAGSETLLAGNVFGVYAGRLPATIHSCAVLEALPTAAAILRLAPALAAAGQLVDAALALPLYVRDKVALTTDERALVKAEKERAALAAH
ncbi:MAG: tRNA (adenosine(37)-N6)-threonylcarbamoyltransferase complex dimerization subunit type 1 TsaB [Pseudomonadota bacterium]